MCSQLLGRTSRKILSSDAIREVEGGVVFTVKIVPGSSRTGVSGLLDGMVKIKVSAPPEKGKANQCLVEFLAMQVGVKKNAVSIISGETNPVKDVQILGVAAETLSQKLGLEK
jgi:uncharacterized protein (TIGR00251 family)